VVSTVAVGCVGKVVLTRVRLPLALVSVIRIPSASHMTLISYENNNSKQKNIGIKKIF